MKPEAYAMLAARHRSYWWHRARRCMSLMLLRRFGLHAGCRWLDVGCGPGGNLSMLAPLPPDLVVGLDLSETALDFARQDAPDTSLVRADISQGLPFLTASFDLVTIYNVLYHRWTSDEKTVLRDVARVLRPGGMVLMTEPAFPLLQRKMDELVMGRRRYRTRDVREFCRATGLKVQLASYFTSFGFPLLLAGKLLGRLRKPGQDPVYSTMDMRPLPGVVNELMFRAACLESRLIVSGVHMPFGVTIVCVATKL